MCRSICKATPQASDTATFNEGEVVLTNLPDQHRIQAVISVAQVITYTSNVPPRLSRAQHLRLTAQSLRSLAYNQQCILACEQRSVIRHDIAKSLAIQEKLDTLDVFENVL